MKDPTTDVAAPAAVSATRASEPGKAKVRAVIIEPLDKAPLQKSRMASLPEMVKPIPTAEQRDSTQSGPPGW